MPDSILGVCFDLGGVLVKDSRPHVFAHVSQRLRVPVATLEQTMYQETHRLQRGEETIYDFWRRMCERLNVHEPSRTEMRSLLRDPYTARRVPPIRGTLSLARRLKKRRYPIGVISNTIPEHISVHRGQGVLDGFDAVVLSYLVGHRKPERAIFDIAAKRLGIPFPNLLLVDNETRWVNAAREHGLQAVRFESPAQLEQKLKRLHVL